MISYNQEKEGKERKKRYGDGYAVVVVQIAEADKKIMMR
jgi:hypothetical protein